MDGAEIRRHLIETGLHSVFTHVVNDEKLQKLLKPLLLYTAYVYSYDSPKSSMGRDWKIFKRSVAEEVGIPDHMMFNVVELGDKILAYDVFYRFLDRYKSNMDFTHLIRLKDYYTQVMQQAMAFNTKTDGTYDLAGKAKYMNEAEDYLERIEKHTDKLKNRYRLLKRAVLDDFKEKEITEGGNPLFLELSPHVK